MTVRRLRSANLDEGSILTELALRSKRSNGYDDAFMEQCRAELTVVPDNRPGRSTVVAEGEDGLVLGFIDIVVADRIAEIVTLFVAPEARGSGVGRRLWSWLEAEAPRLGTDVVAADADPHSVAFYEAMGMTIIGESPSGSIPGRMLPRLSKRMVP